ncbi:hypothetical protein [Nodularia sp. UHCC 0506]|nr:hypothetical protein [Nodularia sp. UHCC 0506]MEA5517012.1 hypothetical protein [Nodularia sp. UHCC 0506]
MIHQRLFLGEAIAPVSFPLKRWLGRGQGLALTQYEFLRIK